MKLNQREILLELYQKKADGFFYETNPFDILIHAVLNTIKFESLIHVYISSDLPELNSSIVSNLNKRVASETGLEKIYEDIKEICEINSNYKTSQHLRLALEILLQNLSDDYKTDFFTTYFNSKYLNDKKSALKYLSFSSKSNDVELLDLYIKKRNKIFLDPILHKENKRLLTQHFFNIWHIDMSFFYKKKLIECIAPVTEEIIGFIKQNEVDLYFHLQLINKNVTKEDLIERFTNSSEEKRHFCIWQASKFLKFDEIEDAIKKYII